MRSRYFRSLTPSLVLVVHLFLIGAVAVAQTPAQPALPALLGFEAPPNGACPGGWFCSVRETIAVDSEVFHGGKWSARIERQAGSAQQFSTLTKSIPLDFRGGKSSNFYGLRQTRRPYRKARR